MGSAAQTGRRGWNLAGAAAVVVLALGAGRGFAQDAKAIVVPGVTGDHADTTTTVAPAAQPGSVIVVPLNARAGTGQVWVPGAIPAVEVPESSDRPTQVRYESLMRADDKRFAITTLRQPWLERQGLIRPRGAITVPMRTPAAAPGIGDPGFDPFNTFHSRAQLRFAEIAAPHQTAADRSARDIQLRASQTAQPRGTAADRSFRSAQLRFHQTTVAPSSQPDRPR